MGHPSDTPGPRLGHPSVTQGSPLGRIEQVVLFAIKVEKMGVGSMAEGRRQRAVRIAVIADIAVIARNRTSKNFNHEGHEERQRKTLIRNRVIR